MSRMTLRERLARWLCPAAFATPATDHPVTVVAETLKAMPPDDAPARLLVPEAIKAVSPAPAPVPDLPPEYDAAIAMYWGDTPIAASRTRARVRALYLQGGPGLTPGDLLAACRGHVTEIE